ncbi:MAG TPA: type II secretion system protein GspK [Gemmatimonadales bacterium]|nr:type II secretion system protein GspK [Gemmatimonadales bacterium]
MSPRPATLDPIRAIQPFPAFRRLAGGREGFALLTALWTIVALSAVAAATLTLARTSGRFTRNRLLLARAEWAREACAQILLAHYDPAQPLRGVDSTDLGNGVWCRATVTDPAARLDLNAADPDALRRLVQDDTLTDAILDWRDPDRAARPLGAEAEWYGAHGRREPRDGPFADVAELRHVRGVDSLRLARLAPLLTTRGDEHVNLNLAPAEVLATLPGLDPIGVQVILERRRGGSAWRSVDEVLAALGPAARQRLAGEYQAFVAVATVAPASLVAEVEGHPAAAALVARSVLTLVPVAERLAVVRREVR